MKFGGHFILSFSFWRNIVRFSDVASTQKRRQNWRPGGDWTGLGPALQGQGTVRPAVSQPPPLLLRAGVGGAQGHLHCGLVDCPEHSCSQHRPEVKARSGLRAWEPSVWSAVGQSRSWQPTRDVLHLRLWILSETFLSEYKAGAGPFHEFWNLPGLYQVICVYLGLRERLRERGVGGHFLVSGALRAAEMHGWQALPLVRAGPGMACGRPAPRRLWAHALVCPQ